ncbi:hypothetical protein MX659_00290 [Coriobacteriia bacterium Es71-Z0120]|uniref:hypothetical protein n=1 Tax=Parvivirga hydrogeniphila TaxID=2939460 RepID=UPI002260A16A|nr:hypothetical protein [Parvivirga hydrogeniphila]MCL4078054.1 hypothetical protein [Parvivirga hydrogeniphila]
MGETLRVRPGSNVRVSIRFHVPMENTNGDAPKVDHIDLIKGLVGPKALPGTPEYQSEVNTTTAVIARFSSPDWAGQPNKGTWHTVSYVLTNVDHDCYLRLRGTNLGLDVPNETDAQGNPLIDDLVGTNDGAKAFADLWFYSNPIFIDVQ